MSERAAMAGNDGPPHAFEHKGKTYTIRPVLDEGVMLDVENKLYCRAKEALRGQQDMMSEATYERKCDELRKLYSDGHFSFESPETSEFLKTKPGLMLLFECMVNCTKAELLTLMAERGADIREVLKDILELSMPKGRSVPKRRARSSRSRRGH